MTTELKKALEGALKVLEDYASGNPMQFHRGEWIDPRGVHAAVAAARAARAALATTKPAEPIKPAEDAGAVAWPVVGLLFSRRKAIADKLGIPMDETFNAIVRETCAALATPPLKPAAPEGSVQALPEILFDGPTVYGNLDQKAKARTSYENVSDVLDAVVRALRAQAQEGRG